MYLKKTSCILLALASAAFTITGCDKKETAAPVAETVTNAASSTLSNLKDAASSATDKAKAVAADAKDKAKEVVADVKDGAAKAADAVSTQFDDTVASAKKFIADKNYQSALDELKKLSDLKLSDSQKTTLENLKNELQASITGGTTNAVNAVKGLFGK